MNIFVTNSDPHESAIALCDQHLKKMIIECAQMIANCFSITKHLVLAPRNHKGEVRSHSYFNHPCSIWTRASQANFLWVAEHALTINKERQSRLGFPRHFTADFIEWAIDNIELTGLNPNKPLDKFVACIPADSKCRELSMFDNLTVIDKYRAYIRIDKKFATWSNNSKPEWIN